MQVLFIFFSNAALIFWFRSKSGSEWRHMDNKLEYFMKGMHNEMKDFHERLLKIEMDRNK